MVCDGPDPPENNPQELTPPARHDIMVAAGNFEDSDEEQNDHFGYEPLPQGPEGHHSSYEMCNDDDESSDEQPPAENIPSIEPMEATLAREVWNTPRPTDSIQMDTERAQQVMSAMANFALPQASIPDWAQCITEEQWKQTLQDRIERIKGNR